MNISRCFRDKVITHQKELFRLVLSVVGTYGVCYTMEVSGSKVFSFSVFGIMLLAGIYWLWERMEKEWSLLTDETVRKRRIRFTAFVSILFAVSMIMGYQLQERGMLDYGFKGKAGILARGVCLSVAVFPFVNLLFQVVERLQGRKSKYQGEPWKLKKTYFVCWGIILLCWIPVWMAYYPTIMSYDFHRQAEEAMKGFPYFNPHHPLAHTWLIWAFLHIGEAIGSFELGLVFFQLFQMLVMSAVMAYSCNMLYRVTKRKWAVVLGLLFYGVFPFVSVQVMCTTKDVMFSALFLLFFLLMLECTFLAEGKRRRRIEVCMVPVGILMIMFRNNAFYAAAVALVLLVLFAGKKQRLRIVILGLLIVVGGKAGIAGIRAAVGTHFNSAIGEMLSVPVQQFARVGNLYGENLDAETYALVDKYLPAKVWGDYIPGLSDPMKSSATFYTVWVKDMGQTARDWLSVGLQYPNEYIDAFLELTRGFWFLDDTSFAEIMGYGMEGRMGAIYTYNSSRSDAFVGVEHVSKLPGLEYLLEKIVSANAFFDWPVISVLFKAATYCWLLVLALVSAWYGKQKKQALLCLYPLMYLGTCLLVPIVQLRYIFPLVVLAPMLLTLSLFSAQESEKQLSQSEEK